VEAEEAEGVRVSPEHLEELAAPASESLPGGVQLQTAIQCSRRISLPAEAEAKGVMVGLEVLVVGEEPVEPVESQAKEQEPSPWSIAVHPVAMGGMVEMVEMVEEGLEEPEACLLAPLWEALPLPTVHSIPIHSPGAALQVVEVLEGQVTAMQGRMGSLGIRETATSNLPEVPH